MRTSHYAKYRVIPMMEFPVIVGKKGWTPHVVVRVCSPISRFVDRMGLQIDNVAEWA